MRLGCWVESMIRTRGGNVLIDATFIFVCATGKNCCAEEQCCHWYHGLLRLHKTTRKGDKENNG
jgi:hypothetical protein